MESRKSHVIIKGAGEKAFSAGGDIKEAANGGLANSKNVFQFMYRNFDLVSSYRKPYIAIMDGITMGGASTFSVPGRYRIATERTVYAMPETAIGFFNDSGASYFLSRLRFNMGIYMGLTGARISGYDVKKIGIATHFVESAKIDELEKVLVACKGDEDIGKAISKFSSVPATNATELDSIMPTIDKCFDGENVDDIYQNLHHDGSDWAMETIRILNKMSPTALKVTHRSITVGGKTSLHDCVKKEYRLAIHHVIESDLKEGVRAILVEKDFKPKWNPRTLHDVSDKHVEHFFGPLPDGDELVLETR